MNKQLIVMTSMTNKIILNKDKINVHGEPNQICYELKNVKPRA